MRSVTLLAVLFCFIVVVTVRNVSAKRYLVGGNKGWATSGVNYTVWARDNHFYLGDWLYFVYDRHQTNVLEVSKTSYENCISNPLVNWTTGAGRDVVPLNQTRHYYFISGNGFCYGGMKLVINVLKPPPPPSESPVKSAALSSPSPSESPVKSAALSSPSPSASPAKSAALSSPSPSTSPVKNAAQSSSYRGNFVALLAFGSVAIWDSFCRVMM